MMMMMFYDDDDDNGKGRDLLKKIVHFQALPELANLPPTHPTPNLGNLVLFFWTSKQHFTRMTEKKYRWW